MLRGVFVKIQGTENNLFILAELGNRIRDLRISLNMTQKELAQKAGVSPKTMERIENGENVKIENLLNVFRAMNILQNLDILIPEQKVLLLEKELPKRKRVSKKKTVDTDYMWKWGDES